MCEELQYFVVFTEVHQQIDIY